MEIKIICACGTKFKFDVEPVESRSPGPVNCPVCAVDATEATNTLIAQQLANPVRQRISVIPPKPAPAAPVPAATTAAHAAAPSQPSAQISPKMAVMPVPTNIKPLSVKPPGEATEHPVEASAKPSNASGSPSAPGSPKMAFMPVPTSGGTKLSVSSGHGEKKE